VPKEPYRGAESLPTQVWRQNEKPDNTIAGGKAAIYLFEKAGEPRSAIISKDQLADNVNGDGQEDQTDQ